MSDIIISVEGLIDIYMYLLPIALLAEERVRVGLRMSG